MDLVEPLADVKTEGVVDQLDLIEIPVNGVESAIGTC